MRFSFAALALTAVILAAPAQAETVRDPVVSIDTCAAPPSTPDSLVMTIEAAPAIQFAGVSEVKAADSPFLNKLAPLMILPFLFAGSVKTVIADKDGYPALATSDRGNLNQLIRDFYHWTQNRIIAATAATYPLCATGTTASKVKTTNATVVLNNGVVNAVAATDDAWTLTGANLATGKTRKYLLCVSAADAFTVIASDDQATAADCRFGQRPADGIAVLGILQVTNNSGADFVPGTTLLSAVTPTYLDGSTDLAFLSSVVLPN